MNERLERPLFGNFLRACAMVLLATMFMLVKIAGETGLAAPEVIFWRQSLSIPTLLLVLFASGHIRMLRTTRIGSHARRSLLGTLGLLCTVSAAMLLPLAEATTLSFTTPIFAVIISALIKRQQVGPWRWSAVALGFAGVLIVTQPGHEPVSPLGLVAGLSAGCITAAVSFQIRDLSRTEAPVTCAFWFAVFGALATAPLLPFVATHHSPAQWALLAAISVSGLGAQLLLTAALRQASVATVVVMDYTMLIWSTLYGWALWNHLPPLATWLGTPLIIAASLLVTWREYRLARRITPVSALEED